MSLGHLPLPGLLRVELLQQVALHGQLLPVLTPVSIVFDDCLMLRHVVGIDGPHYWDRRQTEHTVRDLAGTATGVTGVVTVAGMVLGPISFGYIVDASGSYQLAWLFCTVCAAVSVVALLFVREERRRF